MPGVTKEQTARAKEWDLLSYLQRFEPEELKRCGASEYCTATHGSLKISNGKWNWHSRGIGGRTALDYLVKVRGMNFVDAVEKLCGEPTMNRMEREDGTHKAYDAPVETRRPFTLPEENRCGTAAVSYLRRRGIDAGVIERCIRMGILYESRRFHNCVFVGRDVEGKARSASVRGIYGDFKGDAAGSDKRYGFCLPAAHGDCVKAAVAESPIDALSVASLLKMQGEDWTGSHYLSLGGTAPRALIQFLHDRREVMYLSLCMDNDRAGLILMEKLRGAVGADAELAGRVKVIADNPPPAAWGKDYNEVLMRKVREAHEEKAAVRENMEWGGRGHGGF